MVQRRVLQCGLFRSKEKIDQYFLQRKYRPNNLVFSDISFMAILTGDLWRVDPGAALR